MAVIMTKEAKKNRILVATLVVSLLSILGVLYYGGIIGSGFQIFPSEQKNFTGTEEIIQNTNVPVSSEELDVLEDERFKNLQNSPGIPLSTNTTGKGNPFSD